MHMLYIYEIKKMIPPCKTPPLPVGLSEGEIYFFLSETVDTRKEGIRIEYV